MPMKTPVSFLRRVGLVEGVSFLLLLGVAMPLKYIWNMPLAVKYVGWAHGILFMLLGYALLQVLMRTNWPLSRAALVFIAALLPFGPFLLDARMKAWESEAVTEGKD
jgi:integral membrane protein